MPPSDFDDSDTERRLADIAGNAPHDVLYRQARAMVDSLRKEIEAKDALIDNLHATRAAERQSLRDQVRFLESVLSQYRAEETRS